MLAQLEKLFRQKFRMRRRVASRPWFSRLTPARPGGVASVAAARTAGTATRVHA